MPCLSINAAATNLTSALGPAVAALNAAARAVEAALGRRLFAFQLQEAPLPACRTGAGPCAVWEASSGRVVLDATLAGRMAALAGGAAQPAGGASGGGRRLGGKSVRAVGAGLSSASGAGASGGGLGPTLPALLAAFVDKLLAQAWGAAALLKSGRVGGALRGRGPASFSDNFRVAGALCCGGQAPCTASTPSLLLLRPHKHALRAQPRAACAACAASRPRCRSWWESLPGLVPRLWYC